MFHQRDLWLTVDYTAKQRPLSWPITHVCPRNFFLGGGGKNQGTTVKQTPVAKAEAKFALPLILVVHEDNPPGVISLEITPQVG